MVVTEEIVATICICNYSFSPKGIIKADILKQNRVNGKLFEDSVKNDLINNEGRKNIVEQVTIKTKEVVKVKADFLSIDEATGNIIIEEAKSSATAPLTKNQKIGFPQIKTGGATVVGKGKLPFTTGVEIPPTGVKIIRPDK